MGNEAVCVFEEEAQLLLVGASYDALASAWFCFHFQEVARGVDVEYVGCNAIWMVTFEVRLYADAVAQLQVLFHGVVLFNDYSICLYIIMICNVIQC